MDNRIAPRGAVIVGSGSAGPLLTGFRSRIGSLPSWAVVFASVPRHDPPRRS